MNRKTFAVLFLFWIKIFPLYSQIWHVEPPNWWTGMKSSSLQLMIHGYNVAKAIPEINKTGIKILQYTPGESNNYLFIDFEITKTAIPSDFQIILHGVQSSDTINYELKQKISELNNHSGFDDSDVIYLIVPDRFANGNIMNDNVDGYYDKCNRNNPDSRHGGDLQGIIDHVDYLKQLGISSLWLTPVLENNQLNTSYHGYAITDYYNVDPRLGTNEEYYRLSRELKKNGIKLIMDMVFNHCGSEHWWMKDLPFSDWINHYPDYFITSHQQSVLLDLHASDYDQIRMSEGWFVPSMPDLNQKNPFLANYLIQNSIWWIESARLSGIRMDTYPYADKKMMAEWNQRILYEYPEFTVVGEIWNTDPAFVSYWQKGARNADYYESNLKALMDFPVQSSLIKALNESESWNSGWITLYNTLAHDFLYTDPDNLVIFADNHDMPRYYEQLHYDLNLYYNGIVFLLTARGIPQIFYGSEILQTHPGTEAHGSIRKDFPGGWIEDSANAFTQTNLDSTQLRTLVFFEKLLKWRQSCPAILNGKFIHFLPENGCYVYFRYNDDQRVMIILNKNEKKINLSLDPFNELLEGYDYATDVLNGTEKRIKNTVSIPAQQPLILDLKKNTHSYLNQFHVE